jgi:hypothetical protein
MVDPLTQLFRKRLQFVPVDLGISHLDVFFKLPHAHAHNNLFFSFPLSSLIKNPSSVNSTFRTTIRQNLRNGPSNSSLVDASNAPRPTARTTLTRHFFLFASFALPVFLSGLVAHAAAPVAVNDTYVVDIGGTVSVRSTYLSTMTAQDPSMYWKLNESLNDYNLNGEFLTSEIDKGSDSISAAIAYADGDKDDRFEKNNSPFLHTTTFKGFPDSNRWLELGNSSDTDPLNLRELVDPKENWDSGLGTVSFWFNTSSIGGDSGNADADTAVRNKAQAPDALFAGIDAYSSSASPPASYFKTAVLVGLVDGKIIFRVSEDSSPIVEFKTATAINDGQWHHIVATWDNTNDASALYVDGGSQGGASKSETMKSFSYDLSSDFTFSKRVRAGRGQYTYTQYTGFLDELAIWEHKALTAEDARDLYFSALGGPLSNDSDADSDAITWLEADMNKAGLGSYVSKLTIQDTGGGFDFDGTGVAAGNYSFTYKSTAGGEKSGDATIAIKVNGPPTGVNDSGYVTAPGNVLNVNAATGVLANDSDPNVDTLSAFIASNPADGNLTLNADGSFTYDATSASAATKTFTYKVSDGSLEAGP